MIGIMATDREYCNKEAPHSTNSLSNVTSEKAKRNHAVLIQWLETHHENPYPTKAEKLYLANYANMTQRQLNDWFANARRNIKKIGFAAWKAKHSSMLGSRSRRRFPAAVQPGGPGAQVFAGAVNSKGTYHFPTPHSTPASVTTISQVTQNGSYLPPTNRGLIPLPIFNRAPVATQLGGAYNTSAALYTLYPPHTSSQCSCSYCTSTAIPTTFSSHALGTMPVFSGFNPSLTHGVMKYEKGLSSSFTPLTLVPDNSQPHSIGNTINHPDNSSIIPSSSPQQGLKEAQTPPDPEALNVCKCSPSSIRSVTPLEQQFSNTSPCPTLPTSSESASGYSYENEGCKSVTSASMPNQDLCAMTGIMYHDSRPVTKPLFHLPDPLVTTSAPGNSSPPNNSQWMWSGINSNSIYEAELPELSETTGDNIEEGSFTDLSKGGLNPTPAQLCLEQANSA